MTAVETLVKRQRLSTHQKSVLLNTKSLRILRNKPRNYFLYLLVTSASKDTEPPIVEPTPPPVTFKQDGKVMQMNQGNWEFSLKDEGYEMVLDVGFSKFLDTSLISVDCQPT